MAQWWRRLLAFVIDVFVLTILTGALWGRLIASFANRLSNAHAAFGHVLGQTAGPYLIVLGFTICVAVTYYWLLTGYWGTTIGKRSVGAWVVTARDHSRVSLRASFLRAVIFVFGGEVLPLFFIVDNAWLVPDRRRQCLHDKAAGTLVVRAPQSPFQ